MFNLQALKNEINKRETKWSGVYWELVEPVVMIRTLRARLVSIFFYCILCMMLNCTHVHTTHTNTPIYFEIGIFLSLGILIFMEFDIYRLALTAKTWIKYLFSLLLRFWLNKYVLLHTLNQFYSWKFIPMASWVLRIHKSRIMK